MRLNRELDKSRCFQEEGNWRSRLDFVQRERDNLGNLPAAKFAYSLVRNGLYSFIEIRNGNCCCLTVILNLYLIFAQFAFSLFQDVTAIVMHNGLIYLLSVWVIVLIAGKKSFTVQIIRFVKVRLGF